MPAPFNQDFKSTTESEGEYHTATEVDYQEIICSTKNYGFRYNYLLLESIMSEEFTPYVHTMKRTLYYYLFSFERSYRPQSSVN